MKKIRLRIEGMSCSACSVGLEKYLNKQVGVVDAIVNLVLQEAVIQCDDNIKIQELEKWIQEAGFKSLGETCENDLLEKKKYEKKHFFLFGFLTLVIFCFSLLQMLDLEVVSFLGNSKNLIIYESVLFLLTISFFYFGRDIFKNGWRSLICKSPNMDTLVTVSVFVSFIYSCVYFVLFLFGYIVEIGYLYFDSVVMVIFFMKFGRYLEGKNQTKTLEAIRDLVQMTPEFAVRKNGDREEKVTIDEIKVDDILIAKPGMKIAVDGVILNGVTHLDESFITGESVPLKKKIGDLVVAGSFNYDGEIEYQAKRIGRDSMISEIVHLVVDAINTKSPIMRIVDKISGYFVPVIFEIAIVTFCIYLLLGISFKEALDSFVTVLVVACPCALGLATPLAMVVAMGFAAKRGILIKSSEVLEIAHKVDTVVFDKTGTLTLGKLEIVSGVYSKNYTEKEVLRIVASIEKKSMHPIGTPFIQYANRNCLSLKKVDNFQNLEGIGVSACVDAHVFYLGNDKLFSKLKIVNLYKEEEKKFSKLGCSIVYVICDYEVIAIIGVKDVLREEAKEVVSSLKNMKKEVIMLTGDNEIVALEYAKLLEIDNVIAGVLPSQKNDVIRDLKSSGKVVMMVGDGMNDAPALAIADIGVGVQGAMDIANNSADVIFTKNKLTSVIDLVIISKKTLRNIKENLFWAFFYNSCMIPIAIGFFRTIGIVMNPMIASFAMVMSSLTVVLNALRLKKMNLN